MKLDEFVRQSLIDVTRGVADAQEESLLYIAPGYVNGVRQEEAQNVRFEVAVTVNSGSDGGISVLSFGELKGSLSRETVSRISFDVPIHFAAPTIRNRRHHTHLGPRDSLSKEEEA